MSWNYPPRRATTRATPPQRCPTRRSTFNRASTGFLHCRMEPFFRSRRRLRRRWPGVSARAQALGGPARAHAGPHAPGTQIKIVHLPRRQDAARSRLPRSQLSSSRLPGQGRLCGPSLRANPRPFSHSQGFGGCEEVRASLDDRKQGRTRLFRYVGRRNSPVPGVRSLCYHFWRSAPGRRDLLTQPPETSLARQTY